MGWVIRDPRIIWWGGKGGGLDSDPRTTYHTTLRKTYSAMNLCQH